MRVVLVALLTISLLTVFNTWDAYAQQNRGFVNAYTWPEVPLPNATIDIYAVVENANSVDVQICINDLCLLPKSMTNIGNNTYFYRYVPGEENNPPTNHGDVFYYHILVDGNEVFVGNTTVMINKIPKIENFTIYPKYPKLGNNLTVSFYVSDDFGVHNISVVIKNPAGENEFPLISENNGNYFFNYTPLYEGNHIVKITAYDNSNQSNTSIFRFFAYPEIGEDKNPPKVLDIYGIAKNENMILTVYVYDESGVMEVKAQVNSSWYVLKETNESVFSAEVPLAKSVRIYARDPYNNTLNSTFNVKIFGIQTNENSEVEEESGEISYILLILLGIIIGLVVFVPVKTYLLVIPISIVAIAASFMYSLHIQSIEAGGNVYNGNTCWSCLALQPKGGTEDFLVNYPDGSEVNHPQWIIDLVEDKPLLIYVHQVPCTGCEIQWEDMAKAGIVTEDGKVGYRYKGKINLVILDATIGSETRNKALEVLQIYSLGPPGTPTTVVLTKHEGKIYWFSKSGVVESDELIRILDKAIELYGG